MDKKRSTKIPAISPDRIDETSGNVFVENSKAEKKAHAFVKGKEAIQPFTIRMPRNLYQEIREIAFKKDAKINHIVIQLLREYIQQEKS